MPGLGQDAPGRQRGAAQVHPGSQIHAAGAQRHTAPGTVHFPIKLCLPCRAPGQEEGKGWEQGVGSSSTKQDIPATARL